MFKEHRKTPPANVMTLGGPGRRGVVKRGGAGLAKGSGVPNKEKVGKVSKEQVKKIMISTKHLLKH